MTTPPPKNDARILAAVCGCVLAGIIATCWLISDSSLAEVAQPVRHGQKLDAPHENLSDADAALRDALKELEAPDDGRTYRRAGFEVLASYYYDTPNPDTPVTNLLGEQHKSQIPAPIKALDGKKISVQGFMMHLKGAIGSCTDFILVRDQNICCFRRKPRKNEFINVTMKGGKSTPLVMNQAVTVFGVLHVGEKVENGSVVSLYEFEADDVVGPMNM